MIIKFFKKLPGSASRRKPTPRFNNTAKDQVVRETPAIEVERRMAKIRMLRYIDAACTYLPKTHGCDNV
jgi:hypothetical protein